MKTETELTQKDREEISRFESGFPWMNIVAPATSGRGIKALSEQKITQAISLFHTSHGLTLAKFVPASGAASRMFKDLFNKNVTIVNKFVLNIDKFAFYDKSTYAGLEGEEIVDYTLTEKGLAYGSKPKAVLKFHKYPLGKCPSAPESEEVRTALAEHLVEAQEYMRGSDGTAHLVITITPEHKPLFEEVLSEIVPVYEKRYGIKYDIKLAYQQKWTDTIAVTPDNKPFVLDDGSILHRPAGHGALIYTLAEVNADIVSIKNIDNVSVESNLPLIAKWKKVLIGTALKYRSEINTYLETLKRCPSNELCDEIEAFLKEEFCIELPERDSMAVEGSLAEEGNRTAELQEILSRPFRVCGMVRNQGEAGGGPFIIREKDGSTSLQILEGAQINPDDPHAQKCLKESTHFNPVDLVCVLKDAQGKPYDLKKFVDSDAGFISSKSYQGRELKALELPGLWNGSMSRWNTIFVEVPVETFNPVKTVMDLLRPAHQVE